MATLERWRSEAFEHFKSNASELQRRLSALDNTTGIGALSDQTEALDKHA